MTQPNKELREQIRMEISRWRYHTHTVIQKEEYINTLTDCILSFLPQPEEKEDRIYPCQMCGKMRTRDEGGNVFTVCDKCWDKAYKDNQPAKVELPEELIHETRWDMDKMVVKKINQIIKYLRERK